MNSLILYGAGKTDLGNSVRANAEDGTALYRVVLARKSLAPGYFVRSLSQPFLRQTTHTR